MEEKSREVVMAISNATRYMDPFFKLSAMGTILLLQYFARMVKERKLKETEFTDFQKFLRMTEGKYDIMNVPEIPEEQLSEELNTLGIHYMILPDLEKMMECCRLLFISQTGKILGHGISGIS